MSLALLFHYLKLNMFQMLVHKIPCVYIQIHLTIWILCSDLRTIQLVLHPLGCNHCVSQGMSVHIIFRHSLWSEKTGHRMQRSCLSICDLVSQLKPLYIHVLKFSNEQLYCQSSYNFDFPSRSFTIEFILHYTTNGTFPYTPENVA